MTIYMKPAISEAYVESLSLLEAFRYGEELLDSRFPREAVKVLAKVVDAEPSNATAWELIGRAHFAAAHLAAAESAFRRLVELEPTSAWAHSALGLSLDRQSRHVEGAVFHRLAAAMGAGQRDATRVQLVDRPGE